MTLILLILCHVALADDPPADAAEVPPDAAEDLIADDPADTAEAVISADRMPWAIIMNGLIGAAIVLGGVARRFVGAPASEVRRITDPRIAAMEDLTVSLVGLVRDVQAKQAEAANKPDPIAGRLIVLDSALLERLDQLIDQQAETNEITAAAIEQLPDLVEG